MGVAIAAAFTFALVKGHFDPRRRMALRPRGMPTHARRSRRSTRRASCSMRCWYRRWTRDALPLRWVDPRPALRCRPGTEVRVNGAPLVPGTLVPDAPFELEWHANACRPFGASGPRFDGHVRLTVFREDWGFTRAGQASRTQDHDAVACVADRPHANGLDAAIDTAGRPVSRRLAQLRAAATAAASVNPAERSWR